MSFLEEVQEQGVTTALSNVVLGREVEGDDELVDDFAPSRRSGLYDDFDNYLNSPQNRLSAYQQYEEMAHDSIPSKVLKMMADDAFGIKSGGSDLVWVQSEHDEIASEANEVLKDLDIISRIRPSAENLLKYGDEFLYLFGEEDEGVSRVDWDLHPQIFRRFEKDGELAGFTMDKDQRQDDYSSTTGVDGGEAVEPWKVVHIRSGLQSLRKKFFGPGQIYEGQYGQSTFADALMDWKKLNLMEDSMVLSRYSKSRRPLFIYIDVTGYSTEKKKQLFQKRKRQIQQSMEMGSSGDDFEVGRDIQGRSKPIFVAVDENRGEIEYDDMSEDANVESIVDVEYLRDKVFGAFEVPGAFLGLEDKLPGSVGSENALLPISIQYARTIRRYQSEMLSAIKRILRIHFAYQDKYVPADEIEVRTQSVTTAEDLTRAETASQIISTFQSLVQMFDRGPLSDVDIDQKAISEYIIDQLNMPGFSAEDILGESLDDAPEPALEEMHNYLEPSDTGMTTGGFKLDEESFHDLSDEQKTALKEAREEAIKAEKEEDDSE